MNLVCTNNDTSPKLSVLYSLLKKHQFTFQKEELSNSIVYQTLIRKKFNEIGNNLFEKLTKLNKNVEDVYTAAQNFEDIIQKTIGLKEEVEEAKEDPDKKRVEDFINKLDNHPTMELDVISLFIEKALLSLALIEGSGGISRKKVLIIDDLDRIDPEHIFRLFNVFSAHLNFRSIQENKFGFDQIIFVCDVNNIRNIFHSKYGQSTDFSGYIDKFYTAEIFEFDNSVELIQAIERIIRTIQIPIENSEMKKLIFGGSLVFILQNMVYANALSIRVLSRVQQRTYNFLEKVLPLGTDSSLSNHQCRIVLEFEVLKWMMGSGRSLHQALKKTRDYIRVKGESREKYQLRKSSQYKAYLGEALTFLTYKTHHFKTNISNSAYSYQFDSYTLHFNLDCEHRYNQYWLDIIDVNGDTQGTHLLNYFDILYKTHELYSGESE